MLVHQTFTSEGSATASVTLTNRTISNSALSGTVHAGIVLGSNGVLSSIQVDSGTSVIQGEWLLSGTASTFFVQRTILSGTLQVDPGTGFLQLNATRTYDSTLSSAGTKNTVVFIEIANDASGTTIFGSATYFLISTQGTPAGGV